MKLQPGDLENFEREALRDAGLSAERLRARAASCPPPDRLLAASQQALPDEQLSAITEHLAACALCRQLQADFAAVELPDLTPQESERILARVQKEAKKQKARAARAGGSFFRRPALVMAALALFAAVAIYQMDRITSQVQAPAPPVARAPAQPAPAPPAFVLPLEKPELKLTAGALVYRSAGARQDLTKDIAPAFDAYRAGDFSRAAAELDSLTRRYPNSVEVFFYLGVSRLFLNEPAPAIQALETARRLADPSFSADVAWYLSVALERAGRVQEARSLLDGLCAARGPHSAEACAAVPELSRRGLATPVR